MRRRGERRHRQGRLVFPLTVKKHLRAQEVAEQNHLPCVYLVDSGGAFLPLQAEVFSDREHFGRIFYNQARMSAKGIPQIAAVMGSCTAGGAYVPAMSDETIIVQGTGTIFIGGPPLVKAATGQDVTAEELGGADVHTRRSGVADHYAASDEHALALVRQIVRATCTGARLLGRRAAEPPALDPDELYGLVPEDFKHEMDAHELIARIVDGSRFAEFKAPRRDARLRLRPDRGLPGRNPRQQGRPLRRVGPEGRALHRAGSEAEGAARLPPEHHRLHGRQGVRGGRDRPRRRQARHRGRLRGRAEIHGRHRGRSAPVTTRCAAALTAEAALDVAERAHLGDGRRAGRDRADHGRRRRPRGDQGDLRGRGNPYYSTARLWDDGIIDPRDTRRVLALGISAALNAPVPESTFGIFRM